MPGQPNNPPTPVGTRRLAQRFSELVKEEPYKGRATTKGFAQKVKRVVSEVSEPVKPLT